MNTKLTLNVDKGLIEKAKKYAKSNQISLSKLIESYLFALTKDKPEEIEITPLVKSISGVIELDKDFNYKSDYADYLTEKYK